jgi:thiamine-phosphate pyrophosphorylase
MNPSTVRCWLNLNIRKGMKKAISRFHYITQDIRGCSHQELSEIACANGARWVQLRVKCKPYEEWLHIAQEVKRTCDQFGSILIINDNVKIAKEVNSAGVHLGKKDISIKEARTILGRDKIIGGTANTLEDVLMLQEHGADYVGLGPFRFTYTKQNLEKILGIDSYSNILKTSKIKVPVIAIGGITPEDVTTLRNVGVHGVAVSSAINYADDKASAVRRFLTLV